MQHIDRVGCCVMVPSCSEWLGCCVDVPRSHRFWGWAFLVITLVVALLKAEQPVQRSGEAGTEDAQLASLELREAYSSLWGVVKRPAVLRLALFLLTCRIGMLPAEQVWLVMGCR